MNTIERVSCTFCGNKELEKLLILKKFPILMQAVEKHKDRNNEIFLDFYLCICKKNGCVQLKKLADPNIIYKSSHGSGSIGKLWESHHKSFGKFILNNFKKRNILEIGGGHNFVSNILINKFNLKWDSIEPNHKNKVSNKINYIDSLFDESYRTDKKYDTIIHSHTFEHFINLEKIVLKFYKLLNLNGTLIFSIPNLKKHLINKYTNVMNFEHTVFLSEDHAINILEINGFKLYKKKYFLKDHSIFFCFKKTPNIIKKKKNFYKLNSSLFSDWNTYHLNKIKEINIKLKKTNKRCYLFGAHVMSQFLIKFGISRSKIYGILDNDTNKHNKRLYGTNKIIFDPKIALKKNSIVILRSGVFNEEIKKSFKIINKNTIFWE